MGAAISLQNVSKHYDQFTLDQVTLDIPRGSIVGLVGENGAGKTTLLKCILELVPRDGGEILLDGTPLEELPGNWRERVGVILPGLDFALNLTASHIGKILAASYSAWQRDVYEGYLDKFSIDPAKKIKDYSKGTKMKLNLAAALSHGADLLIFDEATSGLDPIVRDDILDILLEFIQDENHTVLISSHIISDLEKAADYIAFLHKGQLRLFESKDELLCGYGVVRCSEEDLARLPRELVQGVRRNQFGCEALVSDRTRVCREFPKLVTDTADIEEMILFLVKGERV